MGPGASAAVTEARGPFGPRHRWSLWIDGRWPYPKLRFLEGAAPWDPPFVGVVHGVWTLHPRATCRSLPAPSRASGRINCVRTGAEEFSGGNWMVSASPRYAGGAVATGRLVRPFHLTPFYPLGGLGSRDSPAARRGRPGWPCHEVTWLILPVVICLSQRLSHACLSISNLYCQTANGSLNQLSFI